MLARTGLAQARSGVVICTSIGNIALVAGIGLNLVKLRSVSIAITELKSRKPKFIQKPSFSSRGPAGIAAGLAAARPASVAPESHRARHQSFTGANGFSAEGTPE